MTYEIWVSGDDRAEVTMCRASDAKAHELFTKYGHKRLFVFEAPNWTAAKARRSQLEVESEV